MYYHIYNLINTTMFNGGVVSGSAEESALALFSLALTLLAFYVPFKACLSFINLFVDWRR